MHISRLHFSVKMTNCASHSGSYYLCYSKCPKKHIYFEKHYSCKPRSNDLSLKTVKIFYLCSLYLKIPKPLIVPWIETKGKFHVLQELKVSHFHYTENNFKFDFISINEKSHKSLDVTKKLNIYSTIERINIWYLFAEISFFKLWSEYLFLPLSYFSNH